MGPIETMVPGLPGQKVNGNSTPAVSPVETMVPGLPGQEVNGNSTPAAGPIETMVSTGLTAGVLLPLTFCAGSPEASESELFCRGPSCSTISVNFLPRKL